MRCTLDLDYRVLQSGCMSKSSTTNWIHFFFPLSIPAFPLLSFFFFFSMTPSGTQSYIQLSVWGSHLMLFKEPCHVRVEPGPPACKTCTLDTKLSLWPLYPCISKLIIISIVNSQENKVREHLRGNLKVNFLHSNIDDFSPLL